jgi:hypothetical protein
MLRCFHYFQAEQSKEFENPQGQITAFALEVVTSLARASPPQIPALLVK